MGRLDFFKNIFNKTVSENNAENDIGDEGEGQASAVPNTNRHPWGDFSLLQNLTPERLAGILNDVKRGECPATSSSHRTSS